MEIISTPVNSIDHPMLELKKKGKKEDLALGPNLNKREEIFNMAGVGYYHLQHQPSKSMQLGYFRTLDTHYQSVVLDILCLFIILYHHSGLERYHL